MRINGHPKEQDSFARVSGYVEQFDTHSAASTVHEALMYSGTLRNEKEIDKETTEAFVDQVWDLSEPCSSCWYAVIRAHWADQQSLSRFHLELCIAMTFYCSCSRSCSQ